MNAGATVCFAVALAIAWTVVLVELHQISKTLRELSQAVTLLIRLERERLEKEDA
jgi:hypothetical protein